MTSASPEGSGKTQPPLQTTLRSPTHDMKGRHRRPPLPRFLLKGQVWGDVSVDVFFSPLPPCAIAPGLPPVKPVFLKRVWLLPGYSPSVTPVFMLRRYLGCHSNREQPGGKENALGFIFCLQIFITRKRFFANKYVCIIYMMIKFDNEQILIKQRKLYFFYSK